MALGGVSGLGMASPANSRFPHKVLGHCGRQSFRGLIGNSDGFLLSCDYGVHRAWNDEKISSLSGAPEPQGQDPDVAPRGNRRFRAQDLRRVAPGLRDVALGTRNWRMAGLVEADFPPVCEHEELADDAGKLARDIQRRSQLAT